MSEFDKYAQEGAYHWPQTDKTHARYNPPLAARYEVLAAAIPAPVPRLLDVGCGDGYLLHLLAQRGFPTLFGLDYEHLGVRLAREQHEKHGDGTIIVCQGTSYELPFVNGAFDAVTNADVIEHLDDPEQAIAEIARVLKPGGSLYLSTPNWHPERLLSPYHVQEFKPSQMRDLLRPHFQEISIWGCCHSWLMRWWQAGGQRRRIITALARRNLNLFKWSVPNPSSTFEQMIVVARR